MNLSSKTLEAKIYNYQEWIEEIDPQVLKTICKERLIESGFLIVKYDEYFFPIKGFTCFWLLGESHLAVHTFPDSNKTYIELSSCNKKMLDKFKKLK